MLKTLKIAVLCLCLGMAHAGFAYAAEPAKPAPDATGAPAGAEKDGSDKEPSGPDRSAVLISSMRDPDPMVRRAVARSLGEDRDKAAVPILMDVLADDPDVTVRLIALGSLTMIGDDAAVLPAYEKALSDVSEQVRQGAAEALSGKWQESAHRLLVSALRSDPSPKVRRSVAEALGSPGILGRYTGHGWDGAEVSQMALISALKEDADYGVRATAATVLSKFKNRASFKPLMDALQKDKNTSVRAAAAESLGLIENAGAVKLLVDVVYFEKDETLVLAALKGLKYVDDPAVADAAIEALRSTSAAVRWQAIDVLEQQRNMDAVEPLTDIAEDDYESEGIRHKARLALQVMGKW